MLKTFKFISIISIFILSQSQLAHAESTNTIDPLWEKVVMHYQQMKKWAAKDIEQSVIGTN